MRTPVLMPFLLAALLGAAVIPSAAAPGKVIAVIEAKSLDQVASDIDKLARDLELPAPSADMISGLSGGLGIPNMESMDSGKAFRLYIMLPPMGPDGALPEVDEPPVVLVMPSPNGAAAYFKALTNSFAKLEEKEGLNRFYERRPGSHGRSQLFARAVKDRVVIGLGENDGEIVRQVADALASGDRSLPSMPDLPGSLRVTWNIPALLPYLEAGIEQGIDSVKQANAAGMPVGGPVADPAVILKAEADALIPLLRQIKTYTLGIGAGAGTIDVYSRMTPVAGSTLAEVVSGRKPPSQRTMASLPPDALLAVVGSGMNNFDRVVEPYCDLINGIYAGMGTDMVKVSEPMRKLLISVKGLYAGDYAIGVVPAADGRLGLVEIFTVTDPARMGKIMQDTMAGYNEIYSSMAPGLTVSAARPRTHKSIEILTYRYSTDPTAAAAGPMPSNPMMLAMFKGVQFETAFVGQDMVYTLGSADVMNSAIDRLMQGAGPGLPASTRFKNLFPSASANPISAFQFGLLDMLRAFLATRPGMNPQMLDAVPSGTGGLAGYTVVKNGEPVSVARISIGEIKGFMSGGKVLGGLFMQMAMQNAMQNSAPPGAEPADPLRMGCVNNLRMIDSAKEQCALERNLKNGATVERAWIEKYLRGGALPVCPSGGVYDLKAIGQNPECSVEDHRL